MKITDLYKNNPIGFKRGRLMPIYILMVFILFAACEEKIHWDLETKQINTIVVDAGVYHIDSPIILTPQDSGLILRSVGEGQVKIHGGPLIKNWHRHGEHLLQLLPVNFT